MSAYTHAREHTETAAAATDKTAGAANAGASPASAMPEPEERTGRGSLGAVGDSAILDFLIIVLGFGLCRAWIVFCLGAPLAFPAASPTHWVYLAAGALCSAAVALVCRRGGAAIAAVRGLLFKITPAALLASGVLIPLAVRTNSEALMVCGFVAGGIGAGPLQVLWGDRFSHHSVQFAAFASPVAAIVTAIMAALSASQTSFMGFIVVPLLSFALLFDTHAAISLLIINVGYEFFDILTWVLFVDAARRRNENALYIFGLGVAFMFCGMALGNAASHVVNSLLVGGNLQANVVAMAAILCLVIVAFLVLPEGTVAQLSRREGHGEKAEEAAQADAAAGEAAPTAEEGTTAPGRIEQHCAAVARDFGLTPRESEVIVLLAYGRTLAIIARDLHIAQGTARTHIENIYRKLDVHKQQELIDLVESHEG